MLHSGHGSNQVYLPPTMIVSIDNQPYHPSSFFYEYNSLHHKTGLLDDKGLIVVRAACREYLGACQCCRLRRCPRLGRYRQTAPPPFWKSFVLGGVGGAV